MPTKKIVCFLVVMLFFSVSLCTVRALPNKSVSFHGVGVTINLTYSEEEHPLDSISHNITITANSDLTIQNFTIFIYAPVNSSWQEVKNQTITSFDLLQNQNLTSRLGFTLPQEANGTLSCFVYVRTNQSADYLSTAFYTTHVSELSFSKMQSLYNEMLANYTMLQSDYDALLQDYNGLLANYSGLLTDYETLLNKYNSLSASYNSSVATYQTLLSSYNSLLNEHNTLNSNYGELLNKYNDFQTDYDSLNSTRYSVQASYDLLDAAYKSLNQTYVSLKAQVNELSQEVSLSESALNSDRIVMFLFIVVLVCLIALIIYIKRKETEPYVVIRKETVAVKQDEDS